jgi:hypothetical protein
LHEGPYAAARRVSFWFRFVQGLARVEEEKEDGAGEHHDGDESEGRAVRAGAADAVSEQHREDEAAGVLPSALAVSGRRRPGTLVRESSE